MKFLNDCNSDRHVDDFGFWPAHPQSKGINAWIAIDEMPRETGGGFAVVPKSHTAAWRQEAYEAIGATPTYPEEGYQSAADLFLNRVGEGTCNIEYSAPTINNEMEQSKRIYNIKAGDVLFMTRWLWHRTIPFIKGENDLNTKVFKRYSIRYAPGSARTPKGYGTELSILFDEKNSGKALDLITDIPWYPRVFPMVDNTEIAAIPDLVKKKIPIAETLLKQRLKEMKPFIASLGRRQARNMLHSNV